MNPIALVLVPAIVGGLVMALWLVKINRRPRTQATDAVLVQERLPTDINMAHIRVAGIGGLGLVAMALIVAIFVPTIGLSMAAGLVLGTVFALILILRRRHSGPMPSSGRRPGANTTLAIDVREVPPADRRRDDANVRRTDLAVVR
jgi:hypothetical protein